MADPFETHAPNLLGPWDNAAAVTPDDNADLPTTPRGFYVGGAGHLTVVMRGGQTVTYSNVPAGSVIPARAKRVRATGTTASAILAIW
jgi:hypothetical protein